MLVNIFHPVFTIQSTDTVFVYEIPEPPVVAPDGMLDACEGDSVVVSADYQNNLQWYQDSVAVLGATEQDFTVSSTGAYWVEYTTDEGCSAISETFFFEELAPPPPPSFSEDGNWLSVIDTSLLPDDYSLQWYINGDLIPDAIETSYCNTTDGVNLFALEVTDNETGCTNEFSLGVAFDPDFDCTVPTGQVLAIENSLNLYPNPVGDVLHIVFENENRQSVKINVVDVTGRLLLSQNPSFTSNHFYQTMDVDHLASGIYFIEINTQEGQVVRRFVKK